MVSFVPQVLYPQGKVVGAHSVGSRGRVGSQTWLLCLSNEKEEPQSLHLCGTAFHFGVPLLYSCSWGARSHHTHVYKRIYYFHDISCRHFKCFLMASSCVVDALK